MPDTSVSRSLGASFSELTGMPTPPHMHAASPSTAAPVVVTTQRLPSSVASLDPTTDVPAASQAAPVLAQTQTTSETLLATEGQSVQSSGSDDDGTQFHLAPRTSALGSSLQPCRLTLRFWCLTPKGERVRVYRLRGSDIYGDLVI